MQDANLKYLNDRFLTLDEVSRESGVSSEEIVEGIDKKLLPQPSYKLARVSEISSPLGDSYRVEETILYFPHSYVDLVRQSSKGHQETFKSDFIAEMKDHLLGHSGKDYAYDGAMKDPAKLNAELENEWEHYCNGIYGICTLNASPQEIIEKEIAVKKLIALLNAHRSEELPDQKENLSQIVGDYDRVSNLFAPYQRETSSRGKYVDRALEAAGCEDKIKHYQ